MSIKILLDDKIDEFFQTNPDLKITAHNDFEVAVPHFANLEYLHGIDSEDIISGILGDGGDEGIDHCYIFCDGVLVKDEEHPIKEDSRVVVKFFQTKKVTGIETDGFRKTKEGIDQIFNLELDEKLLKKIGANDLFIETAKLIRNIFRKAIRKRATFKCEVFYATVAIDKKVSSKIDHLKQELIKNPLKIPFEFFFWGAQDIFDLTENAKKSIEISFVSQPLELKERDIDTDGYAGFVTGNKLIESFMDKTNRFRDELTEGNVRYFLGEDKVVNKSIIETAKSDSKSQIFWAMNNGLTIICDSINALGSNEYTLDNPQVVNGCQTIHCLQMAYNEKKDMQETDPEKIEVTKLPSNLKVFVKLVRANNSEIQTSIISATNSQSPVHSASLKANDVIQKNIEAHLRKNEFYYERRENFYKRQGMSGNKVVGLLKMAQIIHTIVNKESIIATNDTASLFDTQQKSKIYSTIFNEKADYDIYLFSVILHQKIWTLKNSDLRTNDYDSATRSFISSSGFLLLHVMSVILLSLCTPKKKSTTPVQRELLYKKIDIKTPERNNVFSLRKKQAFELLENEAVMKKIYKLSKTIIKSAANESIKDTKKGSLSIFKARTFDSTHLTPEILKNEAKILKISI